MTSPINTGAKPKQRRQSQNLKNSEYKPLEEKIINFTENGKNESVSALDIFWKEEMMYIMYSSPPCGDQLGEVDFWVQQMSMLINDLEYILNLPYHKFWSQVVYDRDLRACLTTILRNYPRSYDLCNVGHSLEVEEIQMKIHNLVFFIYYRMSTYKESKSCYMKIDEYAALIYNHYIFDLPKMMDLCAVYGRGNKEILQKMLANVFGCQPKYHQDWDKVTKYIKSSLAEVEDHIQLLRPWDCHQDNTDKWQSLTSLLLYYQDVVFSVSSFMDAFQPCISLLHSNNLHLSLPCSYQKLVPAVLEIFDSVAKEGLEDYETIRESFLKCRVVCLDIVRDIIFFIYLQPLLDNSGGEIYRKGEQFMQLHVDLLGHSRFIVDYLAKYPIEDDVVLLNQASVDIDPIQLNYVVDSCQSLLVERGSRERESDFYFPEETEIIPGLPKPKNNPSHENDTAVKNCGKTSTEDDVTLLSMVTHIKDLFPHLHDSYVKACLVRSDLNVEVAITSILDQGGVNPEDNGEENGASGFPQASVVPEFNNTSISVDPLDFTFFKPKVLLNKKERREILPKLTEDKKEFGLIKHIYDYHGCYEEQFHDYDDEYDDTYDDVALGELEPDADVKKSGVAGIPSTKDDANSEEESEEERDPYLNNPNKPHPAANRENRWPNRDVVGNAKGRGQSAEVLRNRKYKNVHKNKHHQRGADKKYSKGMFS